MKRGAIAAAAAAAFALVFTTMPLAAHHSHAAVYFLDQELALRGRIIEVLLRNPHSFLIVEAPDAAGQMQHWNVQWGSSGQLGQWGIKRDTLKAGDEIAITIWPGRKSEEHSGLVKIIRRPSDGFEWGTKPGETVENWMLPINGRSTR
jgi:hypothetical protein